MLQDFQVVDVENRPIDMVCVQFMYKGYFISASKISLAKITAYGETDTEMYEAYTGESIESVIDQINANT